MTGPAVPSGLEALLAQATPRPWEVVNYTDDFREPARFVGFGAHQGGYAYEADSTVLSEADARLIALAPDAVRLLIDMAAHLETTRNWVIANMGNPDDMDALLARFAALDQRAGTA